MIELPEALTLARQSNEILAGKKVVHVFNATKLHRFTFFHDDPLEYDTQLMGKTIESAKGYGIFVDLVFTGGTILSIGDGTNMKYGNPGDKIPAHYQLLITFEDESFLVFTVAMYGSIGVYPDGIIEEKYHTLSASGISPLSGNYTEEIFRKLFTGTKKDLSAKALLATEQRIPGVGNGVLQDILFNARIHPKRKISTFSEKDRSVLFRSLKTTLQEMTDLNGRDTQKDLLGNNGVYKTILSAKTWKNPCPVCGGEIVKENFLGGTIYYCPACQV